MGDSNQAQQAAADARDRAREEEVREHNERTGGGEVRNGELQDQRDEHNERVGSDAPDPDTADPADDPDATVNE